MTQPPSDVNLDAVWQGIAGEVWSTSPSVVERLLIHLLRSPGLARALMTTPSLFVSWLLASAGVLAIGVLATAGTGVNWVALLAPALAGVAIACAYGPGVDPAFELSQSMAVSDRMVLLARGFSVFCINALFGVVASLLTATTLDLTLRWLAPMTAVAAVGLAVATVSRSPATGSAVALSVWAMFVLGVAYRTGDAIGAVNSAALLPVYLLGTIACIGVVLFATSNSRNGRLTW